MCWQSDARVLEDVEMVFRDVDTNVARAYDHKPVPVLRGPKQPASFNFRWICGREATCVGFRSLRRVTRRDASISCAGATFQRSKVKCRQRKYVCTFAGADSFLIFFLPGVLRLVS